MMGPQLSRSRRVLRALYVGGTIAAGVAILSAAAIDIVREPPGVIWLALVALTALSGWSAVRMPGAAMSASLADAFTVAATLLFGPAAGVIAAACDGLIGSTRLPLGARTAARVSFNMSAPALAIWVAASVFVAASDSGLGRRLVGDFAELAIPLAALAVSYFLVNSSLIAFAIVLGRGRSFLQIWREHMLPLGITQISGSYLGGALAILSTGLPTLQFLLLTLPLVLLALLASTHALEELRRRSARIGELRIYAAALRSTVEAVVLTDPAGRVTFMNPAAEALTGWPSSDALGREISEVVTISAGTSQQPAAVERLRPGAPEYMLVRADGTRCPVEQTRADIEDEDGRTCGFVLTIRDVSQRKAFDAERETLLAREQQARVGAEAASRLKDDFLATLSHELRTPAAAILGWAELLRSGRLDDQRTQKALDALDRSARAQAAVLSDLLDTSRIVRGALRLDIRRTDLRLVIGDAIDTILPSAVAKDITLQVRLDDDLPVIDADPDRLRQVFWNILTNAVKFTQDGGRVSVSGSVDGSYVVIEVSDTGVGIDPAFLPFVFDRFRQADPSWRREHGGLGLGLAIVRDLVLAHGGRVAAHSDGPGTGARVSVSLPLVRRRRASDEERSPTVRRSEEADGAVSEQPRDSRETKLTAGTTPSSFPRGGAFE